MARIVEFDGDLDPQEAAPALSARTPRIAEFTGELDAPSAPAAPALDLPEQPAKQSALADLADSDTGVEKVAATPGPANTRRPLGALGDFLMGRSTRSRTAGPAGIPDRPVVPALSTAGVFEAPQESFADARARTGAKGPTIDMPGSVFNEQPAALPGALSNPTPGPTENVGVPVTPAYKAALRDRLERMTPEQRQRFVAQGGLAAGVAKDIMAEWAKRDAAGPALSQADARVENRAQRLARGGYDPTLASGRAAAEAAIGVPEARDAVAKLPEEMKPIDGGPLPTRIAKDFSAGVVGSTGATLAYIGRSSGIETAQDIGDAMTRWADRKMPQEPTFADQLVQGIGSMGSFLIPGIGITKGTNALAILSPAMAKWAGAGTMAALEAAAEADAVYKEHVKNGLPEQLAMRQAEGAFWANMAVLGVTDKLGFFNDVQGLARKVVVGAVTEGPLQEGPQQVIQNYFTGRPLSEGVGEAVAIGSLIGGGAAGVMGKLEQPQAGGALPPVKPPRELDDQERQFAINLMTAGKPATRALVQSPYAEPAFAQGAVQGPMTAPSSATGAPVAPVGALPEAPAAAVEPEPAGALPPTGDGTRSAPVVVTAPEHLEQAEQQVNTEPTEAQKEAGNYQKAHVQYQGFNVTIENPKGSTRSGTAPDGTAWSVEMPATYGYVKRTEGADGDQVDVYLGGNPSAPRVWIVDQIDPATGKFDEHKALMGFGSREEALKTYEAGFSDGKGAQRAGAVTEMAVEQFREWVDKGDTKAPLAYKPKAAPTTRPAGERRGALPDWAPVPTGWRTKWRTLQIEPGKWRVAGLQNANPISPSFATEADAEAWADGEWTARQAPRETATAAPKSTSKPAEVTSETARRAEFKLTSGAAAKVIETAQRGRFTVSVAGESYGSFVMDDAGRVSNIKARANWAMGNVTEAANTFAAGQRGETTNVADAPKPPAKRQPGDPDYTITDARNDLIDLRTRAAEQGAVADDRLLERVRQQERLIREMEAAENQPAPEPKPSPKASPSAADAASVSADDFDALINEVQAERKQPEAPKEPTKARIIPTRSGIVAQPIDDAGNPVGEEYRAGEKAPAAEEAPEPTGDYERGQRVEILDGELAGRHGTIVDKAVLVSRALGVSSFGRNSEERTVYYRVMSDAGAQAPSLRRESLRPETGARPEDVVPDINVEGMWRLPEDVLRMVPMLRKDAEGKMAAAGRAVKAEKKAEHRAAAQKLNERAATFQAAFDAWAKAHPEAAAKYVEQAAPQPAPARDTPGHVPDTSGGADAAQRVAAAGLTVTKAATKKGTPAWEVGGNTRAHSDMLKRLGGRWYGPKKVWSFYAGDPTAEIAKALGAAPTAQPAAEPAPAPKTPPRTPKANADQQTDPRLPMLREHFAIGNVIHSSYWRNFDQVVAFDEGNDRMGWSVTVQKVEKKGDEWVPVAGERPRVHSTMPSPKDEIVDRVGQADPTTTAEQPGQNGPEPNANAPLKQAAQHAAEGVKEGFAGLDALFGRKGTLGSGPAFDEETWAKAKPHFEAAFREFVAAGKSLKEFVRHILDTYNDAVVPYLKRWHADHVKALDEQPQTTGTTGDRPLEGTPSQDAREPATGGDAGVDSAAGGRDDAAGSGDAGGAGIPTGSGMGDGEGAVRVPPGGEGQQPGAGDGRGVRDSGGDQSRPGQSGDAGGRAGVGLQHVPSTEDYRITDLTRLGEGGQKTKYRDNVAAIRLLKDLEATGRRASQDEQNTLARYVGWGGIAQAFDPDNTSWAKEFAELRALLTDEEYDQARRSTRYAHYTSQQIIVDGIYAALQRFGFAGGGKMLEPGGGVGNFIGLMPEGVRTGSRFTLVEREPIAAGIAKHLYPQQSVILQDFTEFNAANGYYDVVAGNPPFARTALTDMSGRKHLTGMSIHNYFLAKSVDLLRPGGVLAVVVSNYFMDAAGDRSRQYIGERTRFLGAIRLPNNAFARNALTEVTTDLIFLQKLPEKEWGGQAAKKAAAVWLDTGTKVDPLGGAPMPLNAYFIAHPEMMLGRMERAGTMYGPGQPALVAVPGQDTGALLRAAVAKLPADVYKSAAEQNTKAATDDLIEALESPEVHEGGYFVRDGKLYERVDDVAGEARARVISPETRWSEKQLLGQSRYERLIKLANLRQTLRKLIALEMEDAPKVQISTLRQRLNAQYDAYVKAHGLLNDRGTLSLFGDDPDYPLIAALEHNFDPGVGKAAAERQGIKPVPATAKKAPIFDRRVIEPRREVRSAETPADALVISLAERGRIDTALIGKLLARDGEEVLRELAQGDKPLLFLDPATQEYTLRDAYLSGNVRLKLAQAQAAGMGQNARALEEVIPEDVPAHEIGARVGSPWIPTDVYEQFARELLGDGTTARVRYVRANASFLTTFHAGSEVADSTTYGTDRASASDILTALMNNREIKVYDTTSDDRRVLNMEATEAAQDKARAIKDRFEDWVFSDPDRADKLARVYNDTMNNYVTRRFDGAMLTFPGKVPDSVIKFRRHQRDAIARIVQDRTALLDHVVGAGKTFTIVAGAMELKRTGLARKPLIAVPNHLVKQWAADFYRLYPGANILTATKKDFERQNRRKFLGRVATGNWDAVIIAHSSFGFIRPDPGFEEQFNAKQIANIVAAIADLKGEKSTQSRRTVKQLEALKERLEQRIKRLRDKPVDDLLDYGQLGVDQLFVDEAHLFKNLMFITKMQNVRGLGQPDGSQRAYDMYLKTQHTMARNGRGQGVVFATGTPISNSLGEMYHMLRYLAPDTLSDLGHDTFDAWANTFAEVEQVWMQSLTGQGYKSTNRLGKFANAPELLRIFDQVADTVTIEDIKKAYAEENEGREFPIPALKGGRRQPVSIPISAEQKAFMGKIAERAVTMQQRKGPPKKGDDNMLSIMTDARKAAMDVRLVEPSIVDRDPKGRIAIAAGNIVERYRKYADVRGTQLVFSDMGTPIRHAKKELVEYQELQEKLAPASDEDIKARAELGDEAAIAKLAEAEAAAAAIEAKGMDWLDAVKAALRGFSIYDDLRSALIEQGIPAEEIAFIHDYNTDDQKAALFRAVNAGKIRVLMGSTEKMGAGTNVQERAVALHHLDVPWKPSDVEQREGRVIRQGNKLPDEIPGFEVEVMAYATQDTLDLFMWQTQEKKLAMIGQLRTRKVGREIENSFEEMQMSAGEMQAAATSNPYLLEEIQLKDRVKRLERQQRQFDAQKSEIAAKKRKAKEQLERLPRQIADAKRFAVGASAYMESIEKANAEMKATVAGNEVVGRDKIGEAIISVLNSFTVPAKELGEKATDAEHEKALADAKKATAKAIKEKGVEFNGTVYRSQTAVSEAYREFAGDRDPIRVTIDGKTVTRRSEAGQMIEKRVAQAMRTDEDVDVGALGEIRITAETSRDTLDRQNFVVTVTFDGVDLNGTVYQSDKMTRADVGAAIVGRAHDLVQGSRSSASWLESDLARAERTLRDIEANQMDGDWAERDALAQARAQHQEVLKKLATFGKDPAQKPANEAQDPMLSRSGPVSYAPVWSGDIEGAQVTQYEVTDFATDELLGTVTVHEQDGKPVVMFDISADQPGRGQGPRMLRDVLERAQGDEVYLVNLQPKAQDWWRRVGATIEETDGGNPNGTIDLQRFEAALGEGRGAVQEGGGRAAEGTEGPEGGPEAPGQQGLALTQTPADAGVSASVARVAEELEARMGRPAEALGVKIVPTWKDLPNGRASFIESRGAYDVQGMFDPDTGETYLIASNIVPGRAFAVYLHELGVHKGLRDLLGEKRFTALASQIKTWSRGVGTEEEVRLAKIAAARIPEGTPAAVADEELIAYFVETAVNAGHDIPQSRPQKGRLAQWLHDLWAAVRSAMEKLGAAPDTLTAAEVVTLARGAAERAAGAANEPSILRAMTSGNPAAESSQQIEERIKAMVAEEMRLSDEVDAAYEAGDGNADALDAELAVLRATIDDMMGQLESDLESSETEEVGIEEELAGTWYDWKFQTFQGRGWSEQDVADRIRSILENNGTSLRGTDGVTNEQALAIAEDAWQARSDRGARIRAAKERPMQDPLLSRAGFRQVQQVVSDLFRTDKTFNWWHRTVGTQYHKAQIDRDFGRVFRIGQDYLQDTNYYSAVAEEEAPDLLLRLETPGDLFLRHRISAKNARAIAGPIFEGTLNDTVWTDDELRQRYSLTDRQIDFYRQFRAATDRSLDEMAKSQLAKMARAIGIDRAGIESLRKRGLSLADFQQEIVGMIRLRERVLQAQADGMPAGSPERAQKEERVASLKKQRTATTKLYNRVAKLKRDGYAPLMRFGQYTVDVVDAAGDREFFGMYETQFAANRAARQMATAFPGSTITTGTLSREQYRAFQGLTPETIDIFGRVTGLADDALFQEYLRMAVNNRSALKRLIHRKEIPGFSEDVTRVLASFITSNARLTSANFHAGDMLKATVEIPKAKGDVRDEAEKLRRYLTDPQDEGAMVRGWLFATYLGGSVAAALVNLTQPVMMTAPHLTQYANSARVAAEMTKASMEGATGRVGMDVRGAYDRAKEEGVIAPHEIYQLMAEARGRVVDRWAVTHRLTRFWGGMFSLAEAFNRRVTFIAAYRIGVHNKVPDPYRFAVKVVQETQGIYNKGNRPNWARGAVGATVFTFKQFSIAYLEWWKRLPSKQKLLVFVVLYVAAGLQGIPFADDLEDLIDAMGQWLGYGTNSKKWLRQNATRILGEHGAQFVLHGVSAGLPLDISTRLGLGNLIPGTSLLKRSETEKGNDLAEIAGPLGSVVGKIIQGKPGEALLPKAYRDGKAAWEMWATEEFRDSKGRLVLDDVTATEAAVKGIGFNPSRMATAGRVTRENLQDINLVKATKTRILDDWTHALLERHQGKEEWQKKLREAQKDLKDWNTKNPEMQIRIESKDIQRRMRELQTLREDRITRTAPKTIRKGVAEDLRK